MNHERKRTYCIVYHYWNVDFTKLYASKMNEKIRCLIYNLQFWMHKTFAKRKDGNENGETNKK